MVLSDPELELVWGLSTVARTPSANDRVEKDQCMFTLLPATHGLYVNLATWKSFSKEYVALDLAIHQSGVYLYYREEFLPASAEAPTDQVNKLAIGVEGGFSGKSAPPVVVEIKIVFFGSSPASGRIELDLDSEDLPESVRDSALGVLSHKGARFQQDLKAWENLEERAVSKYALSLVQIPREGVAISELAEWACEKTGFKDGNLWLNLSDGFIGSGRRNFDGTGGTNGAIDHYKEKLDQGFNFPLVVKLGTISSDVSAIDVYSYAADEDCMVIDPLLLDHLLFFGIDPTRFNKTDKTTAELELELNKDFAFDKILESNEVLEPVNRVGLENLGNTCYLNSVVQLVSSITEIASKYIPQVDSLGIEILKSNTKSHGKSPVLFEFAKLVRAIDLGSPLNVCPYTFRACIAQNHSEFSSSRQQDAQEFLLHLLKTLSRSEVSHEGTTEQALFEFEIEDRLEVDGMVGYSKRKEVLFPLSIVGSDLDTPTAPEAKIFKSENVVAEKPPQSIPFIKCLEHTLAASPIQGFRSPVTNEVSTHAFKSFKFATFPKYLFVVVNRYFFDASFNAAKIDCGVEMPERINLEKYRGVGRKEGEPELSSTKFVADPNFVDQILAMGFSLAQANAACAAVKNESAESALQWILAGNVSVEAETASLEFPTESISLLTSMGFPESHVHKALLSTNGDLERAADWLFSHPVEEAETAAVNHLPTNDGLGEYALQGMVSHMGKSTSVGHYVCHLKDFEKNEWILFNDLHAAKSKHPPLDYGYIYLYKRLQ